MSGASDELLNDETRAHLATERALLMDLERAARRCAERGYPCSCCDLGYDEDECSCFDSMAESKERVAGLAGTIAALDAFRKDKP